MMRRKSGRRKGPEAALIYEGVLVRRLLSGPVQQTPLCIDEGEGEEILSLERILGAFEGASIKLTIEASEDVTIPAPKEP
jgi:hypothetical protein